MSKATQIAKILAYCGKHGSITVREATVKLDINSPTKRISEMVKAGYDVQKEDCVRVREDGSTVRFKRYYISHGKVGEAGC